MSADQFKLVDFQILFIKHQAETILGVTLRRFYFEAKNENFWRYTVPSTVIQLQNYSDSWKHGMYKKILNAILRSFSILYCGMCFYRKYDHSNQNSL